MHILLTDGNCSGGQGCLAIADQLSDPSVCQLIICRDRCDPRDSFSVAMTSNPRPRSTLEIEVVTATLESGYRSGIARIELEGKKGEGIRAGSLGEQRYLLRYFGEGGS